MSEASAKILINIPHDILLGCYDMISVYGGDPEGRQVEQVILDVLTSFVLGMRDDRLIPSYETETEIYQQLEKYFPDLKSSVIGRLEEMAQSLEETIEENESFDVKEEIDPSVIENLENTQIENKEENSEEGIKSLTFSDLPEKDIL